MAYLGVPGGLSGVINQLSNRSTPSIRIDPKTVRKAVREGVSPRSFEQIKGMLDSVVSPEMYEYINSDYVKPWMETTLPQNGLSWLSITRGFHLRALTNETSETHVERFIKRRAELEMELLRNGQKIQKNSSSPEAFDECWCAYLVDFLKQHTEVEPAFLDHGFQIWALLKSGAVQPQKEQAGLLYSLYTRLRIDFYYQLLCNLSLDLIQWFKESDGIAGQEQWIIENSLFGDMVPVFDGRSLTLPFEQLMDTWRRNAAPDGGVLSWAQIAQSLPNPQGIDPEMQSLAPGQTRDDRKAAICKNKQSRLREWRQGTRPQPDQLKQFIQNLLPDGSDVSSAIMRADIAFIWGAFILDEMALFEDYGMNRAFNETLPAFELYPAYWTKYQAQAAQIVAA